MYCAHKDLTFGRRIQLQALIRRPVLRCRHVSARRILTSLSPFPWNFPARYSLQIRFEHVACRSLGAKQQMSSRKQLAADERPFLNGVGQKRFYTVSASFCLQQQHISLSVGYRCIVGKSETSRHAHGGIHSKGYDTLIV
jgi:hypothetical protein